MAKNKFHEGLGPSQRQLRVSETIRRALSEVLARGDIHDPELNRLSITVGEVQCTPDLKIATAYVLPLGGQGQDTILQMLARNKAELRRMIGRKLGLKFTPDLRFRLDETFDRLDETRRLFSDETVQRDIAQTDEDPQPEGPGGAISWRACLPYAPARPARLNAKTSPMLTSASRCAAWMRRPNRSHCFWMRPMASDLAIFQP